MQEKRQWMQAELRQVAKEQNVIIIHNVCFFALKNRDDGFGQKKRKKGTDGSKRGKGRWPGKRRGIIFLRASVDGAN